MTKREIPRNAEGKRVCEFCLEREVPESLGTKPRRYCSRNCRQRAYEARKTRKAIRKAVANGFELGRRKSRDDAESQGTSRDDAEGTSRDVPKPQVGPEVAATPDPAPLPPPRKGRRRQSMTASAMPLPGLADADGE